jgi:cell division protein FtsB
VPTGPRSTARPGPGPGRGRARARTAARKPSAPRTPEKPTTAAPLTVAATPGAAPSTSLTARAIALAVVLLILTISYASSLRIYFAQAHDIAATKAEIAERQQRIVVLQGELAKWQDENYIKTQARERLGWVVPGEIGYKVVDAQGKPLGGGAEISAEAAEPVEPADDAWWAKLWGSVAAADQPAPVVAETEPDKPITEQTKTR